MHHKVEESKIQTSLVFSQHLKWVIMSNSVIESVVYCFKLINWKC